MDAKRSTAELLVGAASEEFRAHGFLGTDTNKIARRAGFAPQTFYRWFADKTEIFIAVYDAWVKEEFDLVEALIGGNASNRRLIDAAIAHHRAYRMFRRSLRQLALEDLKVRQARAASRLGQIRRIKAWLEPASPSAEAIALFILENERLCDAIADDEIADLGLDEQAVRDHLERLYQALRRVR